jgi:exodeoxyribonuclease V alpha subunit
MHAPWILDLAEAVRPASNRSYAVMRACIEGNAGHLSFLKDASRKAFRDFLEVRWKPWVEASKSWFGLDEAELEQQRAALCWLRRFQLLCSDNAQVERANGWGMQFLANGEAMRGNAVPHGCPVLIQKNSPALALTNGDLGIAVALPGERIASMVGFDSGEGSARWFPMARLPAYSPAFGLTIHKSQGSEWEEVAIELPDAASGEMLTRNLLYTAVTRASRNAHLIGAEEGLKRLIPE